MADLRHVGTRLRAIRKERGWTLEHLASMAGLSASTLSRLESGKRQASLELLIPLTRHLGVRIDELLDNPDRDPRVRRRGTTRDGMIIAPLTRAESDVRAFKITYLPALPNRELQSHPGWEWIYVLAGRLLLRLGDQELELGPGEAAEFDTMTPHQMAAADGEYAEVISLFNTVGERLHLHGT